MAMLEGVVMDWDMALVAAMAGCVGYLCGFVTAALMHVAGDVDEAELEAVLREVESLQAEAQARRAVRAGEQKHV